MKIKILSLYFIYFLDLMGLVFVYVVLSPLIVNSSSMLPESTSLSTRNVIVGLLFATYPLAQFFAAPILGDLSDRFGRRIILLLSSFGTALSLALSGISILTLNLPLLFISRFTSGLFAGNLTVAQATVSESVPSDRQEHYMSLFSAVGGMSWTLGPFIAAFLSDHRLLPFFNYATPFWFLTICMFLAFFLIYWKVSETRTGPTGKKLKLHKVASNLLSVFRIQSVTVPFIASLITIFAWMMYQGFLAPYLIEKFHFTEEWEGYAYAVSSLFWMFGGFLTAHFLRRTPATKLIMIPLVLSGVSVFCYLFTFHPYIIWPLLAIANLTQAMVTACFFGIFARFVPPESHGKIFGSWNAGFALASTLGPFLSGIFVRFQINLPYLLASLIMVATAFYYIVWFKRSKATR
ncbi:MAG: MFS transporter [Simkania sp.]|nr:MFS transporter [Simkania sp.]MCP5490861.1 MFS transporter [Chlamydiales bacterium]